MPIIIINDEVCACVQSIMNSNCRNMPAEVLASENGYSGSRLLKSWYNPQLQLHKQLATGALRWRSSAGLHLRLCVYLVVFQPVQSLHIHMYVYMV